MWLRRPGCLEEFAEIWLQPRFLKPGARPGFWNRVFETGGTARFLRPGETGRAVLVFETVFFGEPEVLPVFLRPGETGRRVLVSEAGVPPGVYLPGTGKGGLGAGRIRQRLPGTGYLLS